MAAAAEVWRSWRDGRTPTPDELAAAVIHYAEHALVPFRARSSISSFFFAPALTRRMLDRLRLAPSAPSRGSL